MSFFIKKNTYLYHTKLRLKYRISGEFQFEDLYAIQKQTILILFWRVEVPWLPEDDGYINIMR